MINIKYCKLCRNAFDMGEGNICPKCRTTKCKRCGNPSGKFEHCMDCVYELNKRLKGDGQSN